MIRRSTNSLPLLCVGVFSIFAMLLTPSLSANESDYSVGEIGPEEITDSLFINGTVFHDANSNGVMEAGEPGLSGWTIRLARDDAEISNVTSDELGGYIFEGLGPGSYMVSEDLMPEWNQTAPGGGFYQITLVDKNGHRYDFGNSKGDIERALIEYPRMRPSPQELRIWIDQYNESPRAILDPQIERDLGESPTGSLSLLNYLQYTPSERNQWACGNCWAWAGTGVMEIGLAVEEGVKDRLSIQYLNSNYNGGSGSNWACCGGWLNILADFYGGTGKAIPWSNANAHWQDDNRYCEIGSTIVPAGSITTSPDYPIESIEAQAIPTQDVGSAIAIANIKNVLNQNKAVFFGFLLPTDYEWNNLFNFWVSESETDVWDPTFTPGKGWNEEEGGGHAVLCVGYNDDPSGRYWIMVNSWGTTANRPNGIFRVDMDMNYNCYSLDGADVIPAFYWETLDLEYDLPASDTIIFRDGIWFVDVDQDQTPDGVFWYGTGGDVPIVGDINKDGTDDVAVFRNGVWFVDVNRNQIPDITFWYGAAGDIPVVGDFNHDETDDVAVFRDGVWFVDVNGDRSADSVFWYGAAGDVPVVGDFNHDETDDVAVFRDGVWFVDVNGDQSPDSVFWYGAAGDVPVVGDINNDGTDDIAVFRNSVWFVDVNGDQSADSVFLYGAAGDVPIVGDAA